MEFQLPGFQLIIHNFHICHMTAEGEVLYVTPTLEGDSKVLSNIFSAEKTS